MKSEDFKGAINYFKEALSFVRSDRVKAQCLHNLSSVYYYLNDYRQQQVLLEQSLALLSRKDRFAGLRDLGECLIIQEKTKEALDILTEAESYYPLKPLTEENIRMYEWLSVGSNSFEYAKKRGDELEKLVLEKQKLETLLRQQAMQQLLIRLESERRSKGKINFLMILAISGGIMVLLIILSWRIWWYRLRKNLGKKILAIVNRWEEEDAQI